MSAIPNWLWFAAGVSLGAAEALAPGLFMIWLGLAAFVTGLAGLLLPMSLGWSLVLFCGLALASLAVGRAVYGSAQVRSDRPFLNRRAEALIGRIFVLDEAIEEGSGRIRVDDSVWRVVGPNLPAGSRVRVSGFEDGVVLRVEPT